jgi:presenilin-like A22 family membrane protease
MKHNIKITMILITMFFITQLIGLFVIHAYSSGITLPYGMEPPPELKNETSTSLISIIFSFIIALALFFFLIKFKAETFLRIWFFVVTIIAIALSLNVIAFKLTPLYASALAIIIAIPLAYIKIFRRNMLVHNLTELLIYPGIAAVFIPIINLTGITILLLLISIYDIWAVWHAEFMQKMATYQINTLKFFTGFFIPYAGKKEREKIKLIKEKYSNKSEKFMNEKFKKAKIRVNLAILGGGDVIFPIITAGVFYKLYNAFLPAFIITITATIALLALFLLARKGKFYPAMPFLTIGMYLGMIINFILSSFKFF